MEKSLMVCFQLAHQDICIATLLPPNNLYVTAFLSLMIYIFLR